MATVDIVIPTRSGVHPEAFSNLNIMIRETQCYCGGHAPWKCPNGKHSLRLLPFQRGSSVIHWGRNQMITMALYGQTNQDGRPSAEYLFLMDDDMLSMPGHLSRLLSYKLDFVTGIATVRKDPPRPNIRMWSKKDNFFITPVEWDWDTNKLIEVDAVGAAYMLIKRRVFEVMGAEWLRCGFERLRDKAKFLPKTVGGIDTYWDRVSKVRQENFRKALEDGGDWKKADCWWFEFLPNEDASGEYGEDIGFCWKVKKLGFKIYADPQVLPGHIGDYGYSITDYRDWVQRGKDLGAMPETLPANEVQLAKA